MKNNVIPRLKEFYKTTLKEQLAKDLAVANCMQVPKIEKIVVNIGVKEAVKESKALNLVKEMLEAITGQVAVKTKAKKSIASFKLREGMTIGVRVTLRGDTMYYFLDKLINIALPGVRDFQGVSKKFDGNGNYNLGIVDWLVFPEVDYDKVDQTRGMNITIQTTAKTDQAAYALLKGFSMPFQK